MRLSVPQLGTEELEAVGRVLQSGYLTQGQVAIDFEQSVKDYIGTRAAFAVSSATTGLQLVLRGLGISPGAEVVMPSFSFPATANAVVAQGGQPVFVDIDLSTFNIDPAGIEDAVTPRTEVLMPVHAFGLCADMDPVNEVAQRHSLAVVEDSACALTATYHDRPAGSLGTAGVFSFHPRKIITTGEGGMITTDDNQLIERLVVLRSHGSVRGDLYLDFVDAGYNYRMSDVNAAIGLVQMSRLETIAQDRRRLATMLTERLADVERVRTPVVPTGYTHSFQSYVVTLDDSVDRDAVIVAMRDAGVETTLGTYGLHLQPYFRERFGLSPHDFPQGTRAHRQALTLPMHSALSAGDLDQIAATLEKIVRQA